MGQYYKFMNIDKKEKCDRNRHGYKLMEHSFLGNDYCTDILRLLSSEWKGDRVIHVGDYAEPYDETTTQSFVEDTLRELNVPEENSLYNYCDSFKEVIPKSNADIRYVYNLDRREYVDLYMQPIQWCYQNDNQICTAKINSFALLIGCGNGLGGGDYHGVNSRLVGYWAGCNFVASSELLKEYNNYKPLDYIFSETNDYKDMIHYNEEDIIACEIDVLNDELAKFKKYGYDVNDCMLDSYGLTEKEKKVLDSVLTINKDLQKGKEDDYEL